jgi:DNA modification methylase
MVEVFREVRRVLRDDGTLWLNIGDSYAAGGMGGASSDKSTLSRHGADGRSPAADALGDGLSRRCDIPPKNLVGIPWRLAFALQADGWILRSDIIWHKPNPMPESVRDRPTKAHEYVFMFSKRSRYYWDQDAVREKHTRIWNPDTLGGNLSAGVHKRNGAMREAERNTPKPNPLGRNLRDVWTIATQPFSGAHFACMPPKLAETCIKAGCPEGGTVLDPFFGAGTTGLVANRLRREYVGIELSPEYAAMAEQRIEDDCPLFNR